MTGAPSNARPEADRERVPSPESAGQAGQARRRLIASAALVAVGIALCVAVDDGLGGWITLGAMASLLLAIHRLGRSGPA